MKKQIKNVFLFLVVLLTIFAGSTTALAQGSAGNRAAYATSQHVSVEVPTVVRLDRPNSRTVKLNGTSSSFNETQRWGAVSNAGSGARMTLTAGSLTADIGSGPEIPVRLRLEKIRGTSWNLSRPMDTSTGGTALVRAQSNGPGHASFRLNITIAGSKDHDLEAGKQYTTTVIGTIKKR